MHQSEIGQPDDLYFMNLALEQSLLAYREGEVPVGAIAVYQNSVIAEAYNQIEQLKDAMAHAEMLVLKKAEDIVGDWRLNDVTIYVTKEPCSMCAGAMVNCRLGKVVFGIRDKKYGAAGGAINITNLNGSLHNVVTVGAVLETECLEIFQRFFKDLRSRKK